jgi:hypothetical protein
VDAEANEEHGMAALSRLLEAESGLVRTEPPRSGGPHTISAPFQSVILQAAQKLDERRRDSMASPAISSPVSGTPAISSPAIAPPSGPGVDHASYDALGLDFGERDFTDTETSDGDASRNESSGGSLTGGPVTGGPVNRDPVGHDLGRHERPTFASEGSRPPMTPVLQAHAPEPEAFLVPPRVRRRRAMLATLSALAVLACVALAASYLGKRAGETRAQATGAGSEPSAPEPIAAINEPSAELASPDIAQRLDDAPEHAAGDEPASGELPAAARNISSPPAASPLPAADPIAHGAREPAPARAPVKASSFALHITSRPSRAAVFEAGRMLGKTPLTVTIGASSVASTSREFVLRLPGHFSSRLYQGASTSDVTAGVVLVPRPAVVDAPDAGTAEADVDSAEARPDSPRARRKDLGIRLRR